MKKIFPAIFFSFICFISFSVELPDEFYGIWEGKDRYVFFEKNNENNEMVIVLKEYYGWYLDRTAEPESYNDIEKRVRNAGTTKTPEHINVSLVPGDLDCYELELYYSKYEKNCIPVVIIGNNLYLNFYIKDNNNPNFWRGFVSTQGLTVSSQAIPENLSCLYFVDDKIFDIRYWKSDMEYTDDLASFTFEGNDYYVNKHIISSDNLYSCTNGRSKRIRNLTTPVAILNDELQFYNEKSILLLDETPYLVKLADKKTMEDLFQLIKNQNSKRKPEPSPLFPVKEIQIYEELIQYLQKENYQIDDFPVRQHDFGHNLIHIE